MAALGAVLSLGNTKGAAAPAPAAAAERKVAVFSDALNHASIIDGIRLAKRPGVDTFIYRHNDMDHLEDLLKLVPSDTMSVVVTDTVFSMDGDVVDLERLVRLKHKYNFLLIVDEAHATLVFGERGGGVAEALGVEHDIDLHVGTLSKAIGSFGGFIACTAQMKDWIINRGRSFIYSTSLPLPTVCAASAALRAAQEEPWRRKHVWALAHRFRVAVEEALDNGDPTSSRRTSASGGGGVGGVEGLGLLGSIHSPIIPVVVGHEENALKLTQALLSHRMHVPTIRPPTVPPGTSRLRVSLSASHTLQDVDHLAHTLVASMKEHGISLVQKTTPTS